jgi:SAM-dependent methyltransferase
MSDDYAALASVYESLGMASFAETLTPRLIDYAQSNDMTGRRVVDLGCGTGASVRWFANHGYNVTGIDLSPSMLKIAKNSIPGSGFSFQLLEGDIRALNDLHDIDLVLALDVLNELNSLRDLETIFKSVANILAHDKWFIFDLHTIEGLAQRDSANGIVADTDDLSVYLTNHFDYDRQASTASYTIFERGGNTWQRRRATRILRGFPIQVATALLQRAGFGIIALLNTRLEVVDSAAMREPRVIILARRVRSETE